VVDTATVARALDDASVDTVVNGAGGGA
jgi:hypothetical protein